MTSYPTIDQIAGSVGANNNSTANVSFSTGADSAVIVVCVFVENNGGAAPAVSSITSTGLSFASRKIVSTPTGGRSEVWWAYAPTKLASQTITINLASSTDAFECSVFSVLNCLQVTSPWDTNASLPASDSHGNSSWTPSVSSITTDFANDMLLMMVGADANFAAGTTIPSGFTSINKNAAGFLEFADIATAYQNVTATQSSATFTWGSALTPDHSGQAILDALTATAITVRSTSTGPNSLGSSTTINLPSGTTTGDVTIIAGCNAGSPSSPAPVPAPSGWTNICNSNGLFVVYRVYQGGDPSSVTFTQTGGVSDWWETAAATFIGVDTSNPIDTSNSYFSYLTNTPNTTWRAPSVAPNYSGGLLLAIFCDNSSGGGSVPLPTGLSSIAAATGGPSVLIAGKPIATPTVQTGDYTATKSGVACKMGCQVALKASGAASVTAATPIITWGGQWSFASSSSSVTVPFSGVGMQQNDLAVVCLSLDTTTSSTPSGWTQQATGGARVYLFTHPWTAGDPDPTFTFGVGAYMMASAYVLRSTNGQQATIDQVNTASGSGSPNVATLSSLTPATATEYIFAYWGSGATSGGGTWTAPGGMTNQFASTYEPSTLVCDVQPAANPTGTFAGTNSYGSANLYAIELLVEPGSSNMDGSGSASGVAGTGSAGTVTISDGSTISISGVAGTGSAGTVTISDSSTVSISGVAGTGSVGSVTPLAASTSLASGGLVREVLETATAVAYSASLVREVLSTTTAHAIVAGVAREVLVATHASLIVGGVVREVLRSESSTQVNPPMISVAM